MAHPCRRTQDRDHPSAAHAAGHRDALVAQGVDFIPHGQMRRLSHRYSRPKSWQAKLRGPVLAWKFNRDLQDYRRGPDTVLLSDEEALLYKSREGFIS